MAKTAAPAASAGETKGAKFTRLAPARVTKALAAIKGVENMASTNYEHTDAQREKILAALDTAVQSLKDAFAGTKKAEAGGFTL